MGYKVFGNTVIIRVEMGNEIISTIISVCEKEGITGAHFTGIGATDYARFGAGNEIEGNYVVSEINEKMEILNITGDISMKEGKCLPHVHIIMAGQGGSPIVGGHLEEAKVFGTCNIYLTKLDGTLERTLYPESYPGHEWWFLNI
ncbi:MAG: PPC domain-containing DNA-binding protein [Christensenellales bacterium]|jgi:predicted DNA-binding protein with PD1-like motif